MTKLPGGEFGGAWEVLAAATPRRRRFQSEFARFTTAELIDDVGSDQLDESQRTRMQAEITRRLAKKRR